MTVAGRALLVGREDHLAAATSATLRGAGWDVMSCPLDRVAPGDLGVDVPDGDASLGLAVFTGGPYGGGRVDEQDPEGWWDIVHGNLTVAFKLARSVHGTLAHSHGALLFVSSLQGLVGVPACSAYCAATAGIVGLTKALAAELRPDVRVAAVVPALPLPEGTYGSPNVDWSGLVADPIEGERAVARATARTIAFLASDHEGAFSGQVIPVPHGVASL